MFNPSFDAELNSEDTFPASGRNHSEDGGWVIETVETSSSQGSWVSHGKYNSLAVGSNGAPHITYLSAVGNTYFINHTSFDGQTWDSNTVASSSGGPCLALDSSDSPHVGIYSSYSTGDGDIQLATEPGQNSTSWTLEMIDNSSTNVGSNCDMKVGPNGDIYVVYWNFHSDNGSLRFAHHNGNYWTISDIDSDGGSDSSLQIDDSGNLHLTYRDLTNGGLKYGVNYGQGWVLSTIEGNGQGRGNSLVLDSNNKPHVSYFDGYNNRLKYASLTGTSWSISTVEASISWGNSSNAAQTDTAIGIDSSDNVHILYHNSGLKYAFYDGTSWNFTLIDTVENDESNTNLVIDDEDRIHISYQDKQNQSLKYATFQESSDIWDLSIIDSQADVGKYSSIVLDSNDGAHISYFDESSKDLKYATDVSGQWISYTIDSEGDVGYGSSIAIDSNDALHISYDDSTNGDLKYATNVNGTWEISTIESQGNVGAYSSIGVNSYDKVHISYYDATNGDLRYATNQYSSVEWSFTSVATSGNVGHHTSLVIDSDNTVHISYIDYDDEALHYAENTWGPSGWVTTVIDSGSNSIGSSTSIAVDDSNKVHISYHDVSNNDLKYATDESGSWVTALVDEAGDVGDTSSITTDSEGVVHISYFDDTNENLKHATNFNSTQIPPTWMIMTVDSLGAVGEYSSIAFDSEDRAHISYHDSTNSDLKYATSEGPQGGEGITDPSDATVWIEDFSYSVNPGDTFSYDLKIETDCTCDIDFEFYFQVFYGLTSLETIMEPNLTISDDLNLGFNGSWTASASATYDFQFRLYDPTSSQNLDVITVESVSLAVAPDNGGNGTNQANETVESALGWYEQWNESVSTILSMNSTAYDLEEDRNYSIQTLLYYSSNNTDIYSESFNFSGAFWIDYVTPTTGLSLSFDEITRGVEYCFLSKLFYSGNLLFTDDMCITIPQLQDDGDNETEGEDYDGDGVMDEDDHCYDGRTNWNSTDATDHDSDGCQDATEDWDDDNDGIDDQDDMCPTGSLNWYAFNDSNPDNDYDGCRDADEDGDDDDDGYPDVQDSCPVSRRGAVVDETGCETSFPDDDGDGVANDYDHCADSDDDEEVDWRGCLIWEDQDNDGVHDNADECEDTLEGSIVDDNGCVENSTGDGSGGNLTDNSSGTENQTGNNTGNQTGNSTVDPPVDVDEPAEEEEDEIVDLLADDWYEEIPILGSLIKQAQTEYGQYAGISVLSITIVGYVYRGLTMRSEYKMNKRVRRFKKQISKADSAKVLRRIQTDIEEAEGRRLLPRGALGDLLSLIELRAEDLGLTDFITQDSLIEAGITRDELLDGVDALNQAREDLANAQFESENSSRGGPPGLSRSASLPPKQAATATLRGAGRGGGVKRPSYHPKDLNRDGSVDEEDEAIWASMTQSERDAKRLQSARSQANVASQVVAFSKLPPSLKSRCHCGKKKAYGKCCFKKDPCPCGSGKKFFKCCAKERGY